MDFATGKEQNARRAAGTRKAKRERRPGEKSAALRTRARTQAQACMFLKKSEKKYLNLVNKIGNTN